MKTAQRTLFAATLLTIFSTSVMAQDVTIIYTNDLHAHVDSYKVPYVADGKRDIGGFANISTLSWAQNSMSTVIRGKRQFKQACLKED